MSASEAKTAAPHKSNTSNIANDSQHRTPNVTNTEYEKMPLSRQFSEDAQELAKLFSNLEQHHDWLIDYQEREHVFYEDSVVEKLADDICTFCKEAAELMSSMDVMWSRMAKRVEDLRDKAEMLRNADGFADN